MFVGGIFFAGFALEQVYFVDQGYVVVAVGDHLTAAAEVWDSRYELTWIMMYGDCCFGIQIVTYHFCRIGPFHISVGLIQHRHPVFFAVGVVGAGCRNTST